MHPLLEKIEKYNTHLIPYALVVLLIIITLELFIHIENPTLEQAIHLADIIIIAIFIIDLIFLAIHSRNTRTFFRNYWLDILAVFPFGLLFTSIERLYTALVETERVLIGQAIFHETLEVEKIIAKEGKLAKILKIVPRSLRLVIKSRFFKKVTARHHQARRKKIPLKH